ncbi:hypothetical protein LB506_000453 [Fusarium annulatum]|nr:hypothetical protein LB506_000453 [Fusarium annulatum]
MSIGFITESDPIIPSMVESLHSSNPPQLLNDLAQDWNPQSCILFPHDSFTMSLKNNRIQSNVSKKDSLN